MKIWGGFGLYVIMSNNPKGMPGISVGSYNVNGLGGATNSEKRSKIFEWLRQKDDEIILLQETHCVPEMEETWQKQWGGKIIFNNGSSDSAGVAILFKNTIDKSITESLNYWEVVKGRAQFAEIVCGSVNLCLINVYCPNSDDTDFVKTVFYEAMGRTRKDYMIFGGDWNTVINDHLDYFSKTRTQHSSQKTQKLLNQFILDYGVSDIFRLQHPDQKLFTHRNKKSKSESRLDFFLIDDALVNFRICSTKISPAYMSDHNYISLYIQGSPIDRGRGYWKFNNSLLSNNSFTDQVA